MNSWPLFAIDIKIYMYMYFNYILLKISPQARAWKREQDKGLLKSKLFISNFNNIYEYNLENEEI